MTIKKLFFYTSFASSFILTNPVFADAVSVSSGSSGVAAIDTVDGIILNPATLPFYPLRSMVFSYKRNDLQISLADNGKEALFPAALIYKQSEDASYKNKSYGLTLAYDFFANVSWGLGLTYSTKEDLITQKSYTQTMAQIGSLIKLNDIFNLGFNYKGLYLNDTDLPNTTDKVSSVTVGATALLQKVVLFRFDAEKGLSTNNTPNEDQWAFKTGFESYLNQWLIARFGYINDNIYSFNSFTAGLGFGGPQFGLHYAYQAQDKNKEIVHVIDLNVPF